MGRFTFASLVIVAALAAVPVALAGRSPSSTLRYFDSHAVSIQPAPTSVLRSSDSPQSPMTVLAYSDAVQVSPTGVLHRYDSIQAPSQGAPTTVLRSFDGPPALTVASSSGSSFDWRYVWIAAAGLAGIALLAAAVRNKPVRRKLAF